MNQAKFIISLDFELYWGSFDTKALDLYKQNIMDARNAIPKILKLFEQYGIHATWATVGYLFYDKKSELLEDLPTEKPSYLNDKHNSYRHLDSVGESEQTDPYHFGRSLIKQIQQVPHQEIATHTFSHYYCLEPGQNESQFREDLKSAKKAADRLGIQIKSLVFPRNQFNDSYLKICSEQGIKSIRGTESSWIYRARNRKDENIIHRGMRLIDTYAKITADHSYNSSENDSLINLPASRFLRPFSSKLKTLEPLRLKRIQDEIEHAAKNKKIYHLWWHPHNFGTNTDMNLAFLEKIFKHLKKLQSQYGIESKNMFEASEEV